MPERIPIIVSPNGSIEQINAELFPRPEHTLPNFPDVSIAWREQEPVIHNTTELVADITAKNRAKLDEAMERGMERPTLSIVAGSMFGETKEHILGAAWEYSETGEMPAPFGDGRSYITGSLLPNAVASGVAVDLHVSREVATHPAFRRTIEQTGLDPDQVLVIDYERGNLLADLGSLLRSRHKLETEQREWDSSDSVYKADFCVQIKDQLKEINGAIDVRLAEEDEKLRRTTEAENANPKSNAVIVIMPPHTELGDERIRGAMTNSLKDIDGLGLNPKKYWDQITSNAVIRTADYFANLFRGSSVPAEFIAVAGVGKLVNARVVDLLKPGLIIDGRDNIHNWGARPGKQRLGLVLSAHRGAESLYVDRLSPARWGRHALGIMKRQEELVIVVDAGSVTQIGPDGQRITVGNVNPHSIPRRSKKLRVITSRNGVGPVTGAMAMERVIEASIMQFENKLQATAATEEASAVFEMLVLVAAA